MNAPNPFTQSRGRGPAVPSEFEERVVQIDRVARVVKGGRRFRFRATVVIGDKKSRVGLGVAKAGEVQGAIQKAVAEAKKDMVTIDTINDTIPFSVRSQFAGAKLLMKPARQGTGIIAGGAVRPIVELAGITNILAKSLGSDNRINNAKAAMVALREIASTDISKLRPAAKPVPQKGAEKAAEKKVPTAAEAVATDTTAKAAKKTTAKKAATKKATAKKTVKKESK